MEPEFVILKKIHGAETKNIKFILFFLAIFFVAIQFVLVDIFYLRLFFSLFIFTFLVFLAYFVATDTEIVLNFQDRSIYTRNFFLGHRVGGDSKAIYLADFDYVYIPTIDAHADKSGRYFLTLFSTRYGERALYKVDKNVADTELERISQLFGLPSKGLLDNVGFRASASGR